MRFRQWLETAQDLNSAAVAILETVRFEDSYTATVSGYQDQPTITITGVGQIRLFYSGSVRPHYSVHHIHGEQPGAGTILYFAGLDWALRYGIKDAQGLLASDLTLSPDAIRARLRFQNMYNYYLMTIPHPDEDSVKVHKGDNTDWRRPATNEEATMWRLQREAPFAFKYVKG